MTSYTSLLLVFKIVESFQCILKRNNLPFRNDRFYRRKTFMGMHHLQKNKISNNDSFVQKRTQFCWTCRIYEATYLSVKIISPRIFTTPCQVDINFFLKK